jgi:hypothetical protein
MVNGITLKGVRKKLAVAAAAAGLVMAFSGQAQATSYETYIDGRCGGVRGNYDYLRVGTVGGYPYYSTSWDFEIGDGCTDGKGVGLYTTYNKWEGGEWKWHDYTKLGADSDGNNGVPGYAKGSGSKVRDVALYICFVGDGNSCVSLF